MAKQTNDLKKDLTEIKIVIEIMKKQIAALESKLKEKKVIPEISTVSKQDARELFEMRNNRG